MFLELEVVRNMITLSFAYNVQTEFYTVSINFHVMKKKKKCLRGKIISMDYTPDKMQTCVNLYSLK